MTWIELAACTFPCMWSGVAADARRDSETGHLTCPKCRAAVTTWKADQDKEMAALRREQAAVKAQWWKTYQEKEDALSRARVQSDVAQMRARVSATVVERHGGGRYAREERQHLQELIARAIAEQEGWSDGSPSV